MLKINRSPQRDGYTFSLHPLSSEKLLRNNPNARLFPRIFIAFDAASDFQTDRGDLYEQVAELLTRLSKQELSAQGGFEVIDPVTEKQVFSTANA